MCMWAGLDVPFSLQKSLVSTSPLLPASPGTAGTLQGAKHGCGVVQGSAHGAPLPPPKLNAMHGSLYPACRTPG